MSSTIYTPSVRAEIITRRTYNRPLDEAGTVFETWEQTVERCIQHQKWLWEKALGDALITKQEIELEELRELMLERKSLLAGRTLWLGGTEIVKRRPASQYNCSGLEVRTVHDVVDAFWLLLQGCGVGHKPVNGTLSGFTRRMEVEFLGDNTGPGGDPSNRETFDPATRTWTIAIGDSAESWAKSIGKLLAGKFPAKKLVIDTRSIRAAGSRLKGYGWICCGDRALTVALRAICEIMNRQAGKLLSKMDILWIINWLGTVLSNRRSAQIALMDYGDPEWRTFATSKPRGFDKGPEWYRGQSNNSLCFNERPTPRQLKELFEMIVDHGGGEPGFINMTEARRRAPWCKTLNPCLTGETLVAVADGRGAVPIRDLAAAGQDIPVYCMDDAHNLTIRMMRHPRVTGLQLPVYRVELDNGQSVRVTDNHRFRMRDGSYREAINLKPGDSLAVMTKYLPEKTDPKSTSRNDRYVAIQCRRRESWYEHVMVAEFASGLEVKKGDHVHHKDGDRLNNSPGNLEVKPGFDHLSEHSAGEGNGRYSGLTNDDLITHGRALTRQMGRRFAVEDWQAYAKVHKIPQNFSAWRRRSVGDITTFAKRCAALEGLDAVQTDADPRVVRRYHALLEAGLNAEIIDRQVYVRKTCEHCHKEFTIEPERREQGYCSRQCASKEYGKNLDRAQHSATAQGVLSSTTVRDKLKAGIRRAQDARKVVRREQQLNVYTKLKFDLGRDPQKKEWVDTCKASGVSPEVSRPSSPFTSWEELKRAAEDHNHRVVSITPDGVEDVYNGTVDDFHNFFVGGFDEGLTKKGRRRIVWINNANCGEVLLSDKGFCLDGSTLLITRTGVTRIADAVGKHIEVWNGRRWSSVVPQVTGTNQKLVRVAFGDGSYLDCTPYHRFSVRHRLHPEYREVMAKDLEEYGKTYGAHTEPFTVVYEGGEEHDEAYTLGLTTGDGTVYEQETCSSGYRIELDLYGDKSDLPTVGVRGVSQDKNKTGVVCTPINGLQELADPRWILRLKNDPDGFEDLFGWSRQSILAYIAGLADTDGSNTVGGGIRIYLTQRERAARLQLLLTKCGIRSSVNLMAEAGTQTNYGTRRQDMYYVQVTDCGDIPCRRLDTSHGHVPTKKGKWQVIKSVTELPGLHTVYCFNEPEQHKAVFGNTLTYQCNLVEVDLAKFKNDHIGLHKATRLMARANYRQTLVNLRDGILQDAWHQNNEFLRLCGVGITGIARRKDLTPYDLRTLRYTAIAGAYEQADELGLERPKNVCLGKPSGSLSKVMDTTEGAHRPGAKYILNNVAFSRHDPLVDRLLDANYRVWTHPTDQDAILITLPSPVYDDVVFDKVTRLNAAGEKVTYEVNRESAVDQLERYRMLQTYWADQNTSITISYDPEEVKAIRDWYLKNWDNYTATSFLFRNDVLKTAADLGFAYLPQECVTRETYEEYCAKLKPVDLGLSGSSDTKLEEECAGGACPVR